MLLKKATKEAKMMVIEDLKTQMPLRRISKVSGISLSGYYYHPRERRVAP